MYGSHSLQSFWSCRTHLANTVFKTLWNTSQIAFDCGLYEVVRILVIPSDCVKADMSSFSNSLPRSDSKTWHNPNFRKKWSTNALATVCASLFLSGTHTPYLLNMQINYNTAIMRNKRKSIIFQKRSVGLHQPILVLSYNSSLTLLTRFASQTLCQRLCNSRKTLHIAAIVTANSQECP